MLEQRGGFHMVSGPSELDIRRQIATQCGLPPTEVSAPELKRLIYHPKSKPPKDKKSLYQKYISRQPGRERLPENRQQILQRAEVLFSEETKCSSYGFFLPSYLKVLIDQKEKPGLPSKGPHRSLLLGALTPDTVHEYATTVRTIHQEADIHVVDLEGEKTRTTCPEIVSFHEGDILNLPFPDNSMDSLHTNILLSALVDKQQRSKDKQIELFLAEAFRVLDKNGVLIMVEDGLDISTLTKRLQAVGFTDAYEFKTIEFIDRTKMDQYLRSTAISPLPNTTVTGITSCIAAFKT